MRKIILTTITVIVFCSTVFSQAPKVKFGKVTEEELNMKFYDKDSSADAVVLYNKGYLDFIYDNKSKSFRYVYREHIRIKIFNKNAFHYANHSFSLYHNNTLEEKLTSIKAATYNFDKGEIVKSKLDKENILWEDESKNNKVGKIALENVKEGSIIELEYIISSDYLYYLRAWKFQYEIPVIWSEYTVTIPEYYTYNTYYNGFLSLEKNEKSNKNEKFQIFYQTEQQIGGAVEKGSYFIESLSKVHQLASKDIPAFKEEPYMPTIKNFLFEIEFELASIKYPSQGREDFAESWESIQKDLMEDELFGKQLTKGFISPEVEKIITDCKTDIEKMNTIFSFIQSNFKWDDNYRSSPKNNLKTVFNVKSGSSAELNLLLVLMLKDAGINAHPVLISTRNNGMVNKQRPGLNEFNSVVCHALVGTTNYVLDATDKYCYPNLLPLNCLNGDGRIFDNNFSDWYNLNPKILSKQVIGGSFNINADGNLEGKLQKSANNYFAYSFRKELDKYESKEKYIEEYQTQNQNIQISEYNFQGVENLNDQIKTDYTLVIDDQIETAGDLLLFYPLNIYAEIENPFKAEERKYPIYFDYPSENSYVMNYLIPDGYAIETLPSNIKISLPENKGTFAFQVNQNGKYIQVICKKIFNEMLFSPNDYQFLKEFFNVMISKQNEKIVLKKI